VENIEGRYFTTKDDRKIYYRLLLPEDAIGYIILLHGYAEHGGRYEHVIQFLSDRGYACFAPDFRGHGKSARVLGDMESYNKILEDIRELQLQIQEKYGSKSLFILAHSMGALIAINFCLKYEDAANGLLLSAPMIVTPDYISPFLKKASKFLAKILPRLPAQKFSTRDTCRDKQVIDTAESDPLCYHGKIRVRTGTEMMKAMENANSHLKDITLPTLIMHGGDDKTLPLQGSQMIYDAISVEDKTLKVFENLYHAIMHEPEKEQVLEYIAQWLEDRV